MYPEISGLENCMWKGLTMTNRAVKQITRLVNKDPEIKGIQLDIKTSGCAGLSYRMNLVKDFSESDLIFTYNGISLFVPIRAMPYIDGTEVDYVRIGLNHMFKFNNPQAQNSCGCGESFAIE
ncbi:Protein SufA [Candidatus Erwinia haradaeae]|uniref:Protein SufA n=1 Tax=Candidatus Erwinia haradaeae TaxID=1922217 RepID=A0A803FU67_9GAMM|nr:Protein SufA [Candidatus Erwinia haradaeae]